MFKPLFLIATLAISASVSQAQDYTLHTFKKIQLTDQFWSDAPAVGDINLDGKSDVVVGPYWYEGPDFRIRHTFRPDTQSFVNTHQDGSHVRIPGYQGVLGSGDSISETDTCVIEIADVNGDGWPDIVVVGQQPDDDGGRFVSSRTLSWYENPGKNGLSQGQMWKRHIAADGVDNESAMFVDLFGTGHRVLAAMAYGYAGYFTPDPNDFAARWTFHAISVHDAIFSAGTHGLGVGDVNGDGRKDILHSDGWWEQPSSLIGDPVWRYHPFPFQLGPGQIKQLIYIGSTARGYVLFDQGADGIPTRPGVYGGSQLIVDDVNGDGLPDVITSLGAHRYGLVWWEQRPHERRDRTDIMSLFAPGGIAFKRHIIINEKPSESRYGVAFSEMQALAYADIDGDGLKDIVTGKRYWGHGNGSRLNIDPDPNGPAVLYWFKQMRNADGSVDFVPHLIDDNSGAGFEIAVADLNGDGRPDIAVANKKGAFVFLQEVTRVTKSQYEKASPKIVYPAAPK